MPAKPKKSKPRNHRGSAATPRDHEVLDNYYGVSNFNKTDAMRRAGYSDANNYSAFWRRAAVVAEMKRREEKTRKKYEVSYGRMMSELMRVATSSPLDYLEVDEDGYAHVDLTKLDAETARAIGEVVIETHFEGKGEDAVRVTTAKVKPWNKLDAIDKVLRHAGISKEKSALEGAVPLIDRILAGRKRAGNGDD